MNREIQALFEKAHHSLEATELLGQQDYYGFAASRAYYAMFYAPEALLLQRNLIYKSHAAVIAAFGKEFSKTKELDPKYHSENPPARLSNQ